MFLYLNLNLTFQFEFEFEFESLSVESGIGVHGWETNARTYVNSELVDVLNCIVRAVAFVQEKGSGSGSGTVRSFTSIEYHAPGMGVRR